MNRRGVLTGIGALLGTASLGGCLSRYENEFPGGSDDADGEPTLADESFEILGAGCGQERNDAEVEFDGESVVVTGTIIVSSACYVAELSDASYDPDEGSLDVTVESVEREDAEACAQCITQIEYEATFEFDGGLPETVSVTHVALDESTTVATAESDR